MSLTQLIENLVEELIKETNSISAGAASLMPSSFGQEGALTGLDNSNGIENFGGGEVGDENYDQFGQLDKGRRSLFKFMWGGDEKSNKPPKIKYVAV